ncbi:hypothetical protein ER308_04835 [Egibacter rhizosphaerae]|uniref:Uncharacterized protein n=1 Tax=Egibacter rhizosphaerae TaxID=1670831 RepID=A0A411YCN6_9ACTN|nr:hypothetical protein [Egibacter rhizosphaerae]QBI18935.1 hypothetical protein ER308_04835 [Egibacter rhizosphaerae]
MRHHVQAAVPDLGDELDELVRLAVREHECADRALHRAVVLRLIVLAGEARFVEPAAEELVSSEEELGTVGVLRASVAESVARRLGFPAGQDLALRSLAGEVPSEWRAPLLAVHRDMRATVERLVAVREETAVLVQEHRKQLEAPLAEAPAVGSRRSGAAGDWSSYGATGPGTWSPDPVRFDEGA